MRPPWELPANWHSFANHGAWAIWRGPNDCSRKHLTEIQASIVFCKRSCCVISDVNIIVTLSNQRLEFRSTMHAKFDTSLTECSSLRHTTNLLRSPAQQTTVEKPKKWPDQRGTRTRNLQIRSLTRYPLRQPVWSASCDVCAAFAHTVICVNKLNKVVYYNATFKIYDQAMACHDSNALKSTYAA